jgi:superfamily II DNA/RNA helicase
MHIIECGKNENATSKSTSTEWSDLKLPDFWKSVIDVLAPGSSPREVQVKALKEARLLYSRKNVVISAPTNSGKSLIGYLILFESLLRGKRALLLEPLRAIAQEKAEQLRDLAPDLGRVLYKGNGKKTFTVTLTTGDYRLEDEEFSAPPPEKGEIIVATPERLEAILRNPDNDKWLDSVGSVFIDEAHLISSSRRGATLEYLVTLLLTRDAPPRMALVSATLGDLERLKKWLAPCDIVTVNSRFPELKRHVWALEEEEKANDVILNYVGQRLSSPENNLLVFVYQTHSAEVLAKLIREKFPESRCLAFHSKMSLEQKAQVRESFVSGECRVLVTTTALALGVNLPATHLVIRDVTFPGVGRLELPELIQMSGRAGRGNQAGEAVILVHPKDSWEPQELAESLSSGVLPPLRSAFDSAENHGWGRDRQEQKSIEDIAGLLASLLSRRGERGLKESEIQAFFERSLGGKSAIGLIPEALRWLLDNRRGLAYQDEENRLRLTALGAKATQAVLPLPIAAGIGALFKDLLSLDTSDKLLRNWKPIDHLILLHLLFEGFPAFKRYSKALTQNILSWMEKDPGHQSFLYRQWLQGDEETSKAIQVLGSLNMDIPQDLKDERQKCWAFKISQKAIAQSCLVYDLAGTRDLKQLEKYWGFTNLEGVEERWRDSLLWLLSGVTRIMDIKCFFYHLKENCSANPDQIQIIKKQLSEIRRTAFDLQNRIKYCSPFGPLIQSLQRVRRNSKGQTVGLATFRKLEEKGFSTPIDLSKLSVEELIGLGVRKDFAMQIHRYLKMRMA